MDPTTTFCPDLACPARGQAGMGNIRIHSRKETRVLGTECHKTFAAPQGTAFYRLRTSAETVTLVLTRLAHGCPRKPSSSRSASTRGRWRTGGRVLAAKGIPSRSISSSTRVTWGRYKRTIFASRPRGLVWMALAMMVRTRLWPAGEASVDRDLTLIRRLIERVRRCAAHRPLLFCPDGLSAYVRAIRETFRDPERTGALGRPRLRPWRPLQRTGGQALCPAARRRRRAPHRRWRAYTRRDAQASLAQGTA